MEHNNIQPPQAATRFLLWFLKEELQEEVAGDLEERYFALLENRSPRQANFHYWLQVLNYLRPFALREDLLSSLNPFFMFKTNLKVAWRNLFKQKGYSLINITGMTLGLTCFLLLALYIQYESSYDRQHEHADRIYRIAQTQKGNTFRGTDQFAVAPATIGPALEATFPEVEKTVTFSVLPTLFSKESQVFYEQGLYTTPSLFDVFTYPIIAGNAKAALADKDAIILTRALAEKYFGNTSPIGKTMKLSSDRQLTVKAVMEDLPDNQHLPFDFVASIDNYNEYVQDSKAQRWASNNYEAYALLKKGTDYQQLEKKMSVFDDRIKAAYAELPFSVSFFFEPLTDIYLHSKANFGEGSRSDIRYLYLSAAIAFIILFLALINYMNLSAARFQQRTKEVGVRKVLGAKRKQLVHQFMTESMLVTGVSLLLAVGLARLLLPSFNRLLDLNMPFLLSGNKMILGTLLLLALLLGGLSGLYPAMVSSAVTPMKALQGRWFGTQKQSGLLRNALIIGQFTAAIVLATGSIVIYQQLQYIQNKQLGYTRDQVVYVPYRNQELYDKTTTIREELLKDPHIEQVAFTNVLPLNTNNQGLVKEWEGNAQQQELPFYRFRADENFIPLLEMELIEGRNFSSDFPSDTAATYILNETALKRMGWTTAAGKSFSDGKVIGVVKDFHFQPFNLAIEPMFITFHTRTSSYYAGNIAMKISADKPEETMAHIQQTLAKIIPQVPFDLQYMDDAFQQLHRAEQRFGEAFKVFTFLALFIACIGLFGLVAHTVFQRTKEIGIRKVLGAAATDIVALISRDFLRLVVWSAIIAIPLSWWGVQQWLQNFAYHTELKPWVFAIVGAIAVGIAMITISLQTVKAALANPVESIKTE
ncbi:ABC transporter permease [Lewinella sp. LCG006]|uniref:ABC transporter permease n=1 Tax=Lewinella sp. LCG006 TaxID=3231911 RepID=UPI003460695F